MTTGKTIALTRWTFVGKVMPLLFNLLSGLVLEKEMAIHSSTIAWRSMAGYSPWGRKSWTQLKRLNHHQGLYNNNVSCLTADGDRSHKIKRRLLFGRKLMTNLDGIIKSRDITLPTKVHLVKAMIFPIVMYG